MEKPCSRCKQPNDRTGQRYCRSCHAAYMRENRTPYSGLSDEARRRSRARAYANVYKARGLLAQEACFICDAPKAEMHHADYGRPIEILWLCRACHLKHHSHAFP